MRSLDMETNFKIHFGINGQNTVFHKSAIPSWNSAPGFIVDINEDDRELVRKHDANDLEFLNGKIQLKQSKVLQTAAPVKPFDWKWVQIASAVGAGVTLGAALF